jgi:predicted permease
VSLTAAFTGAILPILGISVAGYLFGRTTSVDVGPINTLGLYVLLPALAFHSVATTDLGGGEVFRLGAGVVGYSLLMVGLAWIVGRATDTSGPFLGALMLAAAFPNSGFIGIPLSEFAFGETGRTTAVLYLTIQSLLVYTLGVYIASRGADRGVRSAVAEVFRLPLLYAVLAAVALRAFDLVPAADTAAMSTVGLVGDASIPVMLVVLGIQLADTDVSAVSRSVTPSALKLVAAPVVGVGVALAVGFGDPVVARVFVLECATAAAVTPLALVIEYADDASVDGITAPEYLSTAVFTTTVFGIAVLTLLVALLQAGVPI